MIYRGATFDKEKDMIKEHGKLDIPSKTIQVSTLNDLMVYTRGNQAKAARILGVDRTTVRKLLADKKPTSIHVEEVGNNFNYTLLR